MTTPIITTTVPGATGAITPPADSDALHAHLASLVDGTAAATTSPIMRATGNVAARCIDGRPGEGNLNAPRTAGGALTWWAAAALADIPLDGTPINEHGQPRMPVHPAETHAWMESVFWWMEEDGLTVNDHRDDHAHAPAAGCGAADALPTILRLVADFPEALASLLDQWGVDPSLVDAGVRSRALALADQVPAGGDIVDAIDAHAQQPVPTLTGGHLEAAAVANSRPGTTLDEDGAREQFGPSTQMFWVDLWALEAMAERLVDGVGREATDVDTERAVVVAAAAAVNAAAIMLLSSASMPSVHIR